MIATSMFGYLEWGRDNAMFLFQGEAEILRRLFSDPMSVAHPFVLLPLFGQMILLISILPRVPHRLLTYLGIACLGILLGFVCFIGVISLNWKIFLSTLPFLFTAVYTLKSYRGASWLK